MMLLHLRRRVAGMAVLALFSGVSARAQHSRHVFLAHRPSAIEQNFSGPLPVFEFHSGFWTNLHHFLYQQARLMRPGDSAPGKSSTASPSASEPIRRDSLTAEEQAAWSGAVAYYEKNLADKDLLFNGDMINYKNRLAELETCADLSGRSAAGYDAGLPPEMARALETAAPTYRAHWWPEQDRANRAWIAAVSPLVRQMGGDLARQLAEVYQARWPTGKIRVDVTAYANRSGAYTTLDPMDVTLSSTDPGNQGASGFEVLFHEASHALAERVSNTIARECRERGKPIPRDLWHALLFYTTGEVVQRALKSSNAQAGSYTPYAVREGLYTRGWSGYLRLLERFWQPYLDGKTDFDAAIARMVSSL